MTLSHTNLTPGTAIESQTKGHPATGKEKPAEASQTAAVQRVGVNLGGQSPLSHDEAGA